MISTQDLEAKRFCLFTDPIPVGSSIEGNLLVICACFSTLRLFFFTVAPGLFPAKTGSGGVSSGPSDIALETIGGTGSKGRARKRSKYDRFGDFDLSIFGTGTCDVEIEGGQPHDLDDVEAGTSAMWPGDESSEKGIMQTKTTEVRFSKANVVAHSISQNQE